WVQAEQRAYSVGAHGHIPQVICVCVCQDGDVVAGDGGGRGDAAVADAVQAARAQDRPTREYTVVRLIGKL
ncbi:hypothetical protein HF086_015204, partial [Spodoptera exigua]